MLSHQRSTWLWCRPGQRETTGNLLLKVAIFLCYLSNMAGRAGKFRSALRLSACCGHTLHRWVSIARTASIPDTASCCRALTWLTHQLSRDQPQSPYLLKEVKEQAPGKRQRCRGCWGKEWLAGSLAPGMTSTGMAAASCASRTSISLLDQSTVNADDGFRRHAIGRITFVQLAAVCTCLFKSIPLQTCDLRLRWPCVLIMHLQPQQWLVCLNAAGSHLKQRSRVSKNAPYG